MLGLEDSLVGITDCCLHPAEIVASKVRAGGTNVIDNTDENRIQNLAPTVYLTP
jgi:hypothetical protein